MDCLLRIFTIKFLHRVFMIQSLNRKLSIFLADMFEIYVNIIIIFHTDILSYDIPFIFSKEYCPHLNVPEMLSQHFVLCPTEYRYIHFWNISRIP